MLSRFRSFLAFLSCLILLNTCVNLNAQDQTMIQNEQQKEKVTSSTPTPAAIPVLTPEEAENANKKTIQSLEEARDKDIVSSVSKREKHFLYKNISLFLVILIQISFIGYCNFFRRRFRIHWTIVSMLEASSLALLMMITGMFHFMRLASYFLLFGGIALAFIDFVSKNEKEALFSIKKICHLFFRREYVFLACCTIGSYYVLTDFKIELGTYPDVWNVWYENFYYLICNNRWADIGFKNYASGYAMITNGVSYYFATILHNSGTQVWCWGQLWFSMMMMMPLFKIVKWNNIPFGESLFCSIVLLYFRLYSNSITRISYVFAAISVLLLANRIFLSKKKCVFLRNTALYFLATIFCFYFLTLPTCFFEYPFDTVLGCTTVGFFSCIAWEILGFKIFKWHIFLYILPLVVLTLVKPTGIIPAILLALCFFPYIIYKVYKHTKNNKRFTIIFGGLAVLFVLSPLITNSLWNCYMQKNKFNYQHEISANALISKAFLQIKNGCSEEERNLWEKKVKDICVIQPYRFNDYKKSIIETTTEDICKWLSNYCSVFDIDKSLSSLKSNQSHTMVVSLLLTTCIIFISIFLSKRKKYYYLVFCVLLSYFVFIANQYYIVPMFTELPGLFRYFYPAYTLFLGVIFCGLVWVFYTERLMYGFLSTFFFMVFFYPHFFLSNIQPYSKRFVDKSQSAVGYTMLSYFNGTSNNPFLLPFQEEYIHKFLKIQKVVKTNSNLYIRGNSNSIQSPFLSNIGSYFFQFYFTSIDKPGIYLSFENDFSKKITPILISCNTDAVSLLNETFYLSDHTSLKSIPWIERKLSDSNDKCWAIPKDNNHIEGYSDKIIVTPMDKRLTLWDTTYKYCFCRDSFRFIGKYSKDMSFSIVLALYEKSDADQQYRLIRQIPLKIQTSSFNRKENEYKADLNLADIPTDKLNLYYRIGIIFESGTHGEMRDFHLYQYVSGKLNLRQALAELEQSEQSQ